MALLLSHPSEASFSGLLSKAQGSPSCEPHHTSPCLVLSERGPTALKVNPRPSYVSISLSVPTTPIFLQSHSTRNAILFLFTYLAPTHPPIPVGERPPWVLFTRSWYPFLLGPYKFPHVYEINYDFSLTNLMVNSNEQGFLAQCPRHSVHSDIYWINQSRNHSLPCQKFTK